MYSIRDAKEDLRTVRNQLMYLHLDISEADQLIGEEVISLAFKTAKPDDVLKAMIKLEGYRSDVNFEVAKHAKMKVNPSLVEIVFPVHLDQESYELSDISDHFPFPSVNMYRSFLAKLDILLHNLPDIYSREKPTHEFDQVTHLFGTTSPSKARYFRERAWLTVDLAARLFNRPAQTIMDWESGTPYPDEVLRKYEHIYLSAMDGKAAPHYSQQIELINAYNDLRDFLQKLIDEKWRFFTNDDGTA